MMTIARKRVSEEEALTKCKELLDEIAEQDSDASIIVSRFVYPRLRKEKVEECKAAVESALRK